MTHEKFFPPWNKDDNSLRIPGRGQPKDACNQTTKLLKDAILIAAEQAGYYHGQEGLVSYLQYHALNNPVPFFSLLAKVLPLQITEEEESDVKTISRIEIVPVVSKKSAQDTKTFTEIS
ncbi:hypothetical protein [Bartonella bacilliformis]|uniref:hypothetical protein n=1 Tax=Bartonella bacilliformis TaxID=774 RepID=UPI0006962B85|nr:hypothetical protein [Bartonella bacilliformis]